MNNSFNIGKRIDRLPILPWHRKLLAIFGMGALVTGFMNYIGSVVAAQLVADGWSNNSLNAMYSSATMAGMFCGSLLGGFLGDSLGRKVSYKISIFICVISSFASAFAPNMTVLIILRAIMGIGVGAGIFIGFAAFSEYTPTRVRGTWSSRMSFIGNTTPFIAPLIASFAMPIWGWKSMYIIGGIISASSLLVISKFLPESPRWLASKGRLEEADKMIREVEATSKEKGYELETIDVFSESSESKPNKLPFSKLFKGELLKRTIVSIVTLVAMNIALYTINNWIPTILLNSGIDINKSVLMTTVMMVGAPLGVLGVSFIIDKFPRKILGSSLLIVLAVLSYVYSLQTSEIMIVIIGGILVFLLYMYVCFASAVYVPEIWPTEARLRGAGFSNSVGRIVAIFTPFGVAFLLDHFSSATVFMVLSGILVVGAIILMTIGIETNQKSAEELSANL